VRVELNKAEFRVVNDLRGLPQGAHFLVMTSRSTPTGGALDGPPKAFAELVAHLWEDIEEDVVPKGKLRTYLALCEKLAPSEQ
jgi:hypothetical protein